MDSTRPAVKPLFGYRKFWAQRFGPAPFLPMSRAEMDALGWDSCDIILVTGDAYIDHPSFGMALIGRLLEAQGFRVGIICQPDWNSAADFRKLGKPNLFFGVTAGNMDSMVNRYTSDRKIRSDDAYTPNGEANKRPGPRGHRLCPALPRGFPRQHVVIGSIEASLRRIAHYDYWSDKVRRSVLPDSKADLLVFGNAERAIVELAHRLAKGEKISEIRDLRGTAFMAPRGWLPSDAWEVMDSTEVDTPGPLVKHADPYAMEMGPSAPLTAAAPAGEHAVRIVGRAERLAALKERRAHTVVRLPSYEQVSADPVLYAHASRTFHLESNPGNARALVQAHGERDVWLNPPPIPLTTEELDQVYELPYARRPHPSYGEAKIPAWEMIRFSVNIMRGCFGGCTFCSITEHEGRIMQSRSEDSVLREIEEMRDKTPGFTGIVSDLGGPTANMYHLKCKDEKIESACRRLSCVYPDICENLGTDHAPLISLYRKARALKGVKKVLIGSGLRYDLAVRSPGIHQGTGHASRRRLPEDRPGTHRGRAAVEDDEAGHGRLRPLQAVVRPVFPGGGQGAVPDPVLHRRPPRHHRRGHAPPGVVAEEEQFPPRPGADLPADADGAGDDHVPHREEPAEEAATAGRGGRRRRA